MSPDKTATCSYHYDPVDDFEPADTVDIPRRGPASCPHPAARGEDDRCLFHSTEREFPPDAIADEFLSVLSSADREPVFAGGRIEDLDLSGSVLDTHSGEPIGLRGATIDGDLDLSNTTVEVPILLGQAAITGSLEAEGARFERPVELSQASVGGSLHLHDSRFEAGLAANDLDAGFVDARALSAAAPVVFDRATFSVNVQFARARFERGLSFEDAECGRAVDFTGLDADEDVSFAGTSVDGDATFVAATVDGDFTLAECTFGAEADFGHGVVNGDVVAEEVSFEEDLLFRDVRCRGDQIRFDRTTFDGRADFSYVHCTRGEFTAIDAEIEGEAWFTHGTFEGPVRLTGARIESFLHLRDAEFGADVVLREVETNGQSYLHGSTVDGSVDAREATFDHFQFSATVAGDADFRAARFDSKGLFMNSEVGGEATFDDASFAGNPDFSDCRFVGPVTFDDTQFLVEPTFEGTRFAVDPDLEAASYPQDSSKDLDDRRRNIVVARPDDLSNQGFSLPMDAVTDEPVVPGSMYELTQPDADLAKAITHALRSIDGAEWYSRFERAIELSRTAVSELDSDDKVILVYGFTLGSGAESPAEFLESVTLVGVFQVHEDEGEFEFGYLDTGVSDVDYLVYLPSNDSAFESGVSVGVRSEFQNAILRRQVLQTALLERGEISSVVGGYLPVLVGAGRVMD